MTEDDPREVRDRIQKIKDLREMGVNPYPDRFEKENTAQELTNIPKRKLKKAEKVVKKAKIRYSLAGRIMTFRDHGKLSFAQLQDQTGLIQICFMQDVLGQEGYKFAVKMLDMGDFVGVRGDLFVTQHGETTLLVKEFQLLSKAIRPMPEKWHGLTDQETRFRKRYLDMTSDRETFERILLRSKFTQLLREYLTANNFMKSKLRYCIHPHPEQWRNLLRLTTRRWITIFT
jgi:lysyl-tRNA synthetase class 2